jgi:hypothetical protein
VPEDRACRESTTNLNVRVCLRIIGIDERSVDVRVPGSAICRLLFMVVGEIVKTLAFSMLCC